MLGFRHSFVGVGFRLGFCRHHGAVGGGGTPAGPTLDANLEAPTLALANGQTTYPPQYTATLPAWPTADTDKLEFQSDGDWQFGSPEIDSASVITNAEATAGSKTISGLSGITSGVTYGRVRGVKVSNNTCSPWSNIVGHGDTTAPTITSATTQAGGERAPMSFVITTSEATTLALSGTDAGLLQIADNSPALSHTVQLAGNANLDYEAQASYSFSVVATDLSGNASSSIPHIFNVGDVDEVPDAFTFTDVTGATTSTDYVSNTITISGLAAGVSVPVTVAGGTYSKNGGAFTSAAGTAINGDTFALKVTSSASGASPSSASLSVGQPAVSDTYTVTTTGFTPNDLWTASQNGDWWDVADRTLMFQDTAGTVPVTAVGQQIKCWKGKRGNIILTDTVGLQLLNDGTSDYVYGAGSGANAKLTSTGAVTITDGSGQLTAFGSFMVSSVTAVRELFNADDGLGSRLSDTLQTNATGNIRTSHFNTSGTSQSDNGPAATANTRFTAKAKHTTTSIEAFINGTSDGSTAVSGTLRSNASSLLQVFVRSATINEGKIYKGFGVIGKVTSGAEDTSLTPWLAS